MTPVNESKIDAFFSFYDKNQRLLTFADFISNFTLAFINLDKLDFSERTQSNFIF
jgi:pyruvate formate-lyase activating enzyme-like uncharacterized protein